MPTYQMKVRYVDVRVITIEADSLEDADAKAQSGEFDDETTVDFYSDDLLEPLHEVSG